MKAAAVDRFGPPELVHIETLPVPKPGTHEILVRVVSAGIGIWDPEMIDGTFQIGEPHFPHVFGSDGAGEVIAVGPGVKGFAVGDRAYGFGIANPKGGFFAEYIALHEKDAARVPDNLTLESAGALAVSGITALQGLEQLDLDPQQTVMIVGAGGGVGHIAVQLAKRLDLRVFAVASKADGVALAKRLGADGVADGHSKTLAREAAAFAPDGFDGALVFAGGRDWKDELALVVKGGMVAWPNGIEPKPSVPRHVEHAIYDGEGSPKAFARLNELIARGPFHIEIARFYSLDQTARALRDVQHHHIGKLALKIA